MEEQEQTFPLKLWQAIEYFSDDNKKYFSSVDLVELNLIKPLNNNEEVNVKMKIHPKNIVCIKSETGRARGKIFFIKSEVTNDIELYRSNKNNLSFEKLILELDRLSHHLVIISRNSIVNVEFYNLIANNLILKKDIFDNNSDITKHKFTNTDSSQKLRKDFIIVQDTFKFQSMLQKKLFGYMSHFRIK